jgi:hypothetical protein
LFCRTNYKAKIDPAIHSGRRHHSRHNSKVSYVRF